MGVASVRDMESGSPKGAAALAQLAQMSVVSASRDVGEGTAAACSRNTKPSQKGPRPSRRSDYKAAFATASVTCGSRCGLAA